MNHFRNLATSLNFAKERVMILNEGQIISFDSSGVQHYEDKLDLKTVIVNGTGVGDVGRVVLGDRKKMSEEGIVIVTIPIKRGTNQIIGSAEIISRGFVYMRTSKDLISGAKKLIDKALPSRGQVTDWQQVRTKIESDLKRFFFNETAREPMILPVIVKI
jgi:ribonuclease J